MRACIRAVCLHLRLRLCLRLHLRVWHIKDVRCEIRQGMEDVL